MPLTASPGKRAGVALWLGLTLGGVGAAGCAQGSAEVAGLRQPILNGSLDTSSTGVVSLVEGTSLESYCTGTLLAPNLVLTARHCVADVSTPAGADVECGSSEFGASFAPDQLRVSAEANVALGNLPPYTVGEVWLAPGGNDPCGQDLAFLLLAGDGIPATVAEPLSPRLNREVAVDELFSAIGYGIQDTSDLAGASAGHRLRAPGGVVYCTGSDCPAALVADNEWIADSPICDGDSGSPALSDESLVVGVTSRGNPSCTIAIYSSVFAWRDFIRSSVLDAASRGGYPAPDWAGPLPPEHEPSGPAAGNGGVPQLEPGVGGDGGATSAAPGDATKAQDGGCAMATPSAPAVSLWLLLSSALWLLARRARP